MGQDEKRMDSLGYLLGSLPEIRGTHNRDTQTYNFYALVAKELVKERFSATSETKVSMGLIGEIIFPYYKMGAIDSLDLFGLDELIIFSFYFQNRNRYKNVIDIGANIGLHSLILSKCGYNVRSFEPDPVHFELIQKNMQRNSSANIELLMQAVSNKNGNAEFTRVKGNTTGSHLSGAKDNPYGELDRFSVEIAAIQSHVDWADLIKLDAEGHEKEILFAITEAQLQKTDIMLEVGTAQNAAAIYDHFRDKKINLFSQKCNWQKVATLDGIPTSHREGSLFVSAKNLMPWQS